jgi:hypothetical protein
MNMSWSICHEWQPTWEHCQPMLERAAEAGAKRIEIAGDSRSDRGNIDSYVLFMSNPRIYATRDKTKIAHQIEDLRKICQYAHELDMEIDIWHREVSFPAEIIEAIEGLVNEYGDINFASEQFKTLIQQKTDEFFENVPEIDGLVLTLTESLFPVIHVANKEINPPERNIDRVIGLFQAACKKHSKRFVVRPFAALDEDYQYIKQVLIERGKASDICVELKVVPYDWNPFLPMNPMIDDFKTLPRMVELDLMGEYYGMGHLPCCFPEEVQRYLAHVRAYGVTNVVGRVDRIDKRAMDCVNDVNVLAFTRLCEKPETSVDAIYNEWVSSTWSSEAVGHIVPVLKQTFEIAKKTFYLDGHLQSHWGFPDFSMSKWSRLYGLFKPHEKLYRTKDEWAIQSHKTTPSWSKIIKEKDEAINLISECIFAIKKARAHIPNTAYEMLTTGFEDFLTVARAYRHCFKMIMAYLDAVESKNSPGAKFENEKKQCLQLSKDIANSRSDEFYDQLPEKLTEIAQQMAEELEIEIRVREANMHDPSVVDWVLCGGISHEWRVSKQTHGSKVFRDQDIIYREAGNQVIADGYFEYDMKVPAGKSTIKMLWGDTGDIREGRLVIDGETQIVSKGNNNGFVWLEVPLKFDEEQSVKIRIAKQSIMPPMVSQLKICK